MQGCQNAPRGRETLRDAAVAPFMGPLGTCLPLIFCFVLGSGLGGIMRFLSLPDELLVEILSRLPAQAIASSLSSCRSLHAQSAAVWQAACSKRWPQWAAIAAEPGAQWRRQYELLSLREAEAACLPSVAAIRKVQKGVTERHRSILTEWLCEVSGGGRTRRCMVHSASRRPTSLPLLPQVSFDWDLDSTVVFKAVAYLDHYLSTQEVEQLSR